MAAGNETHGTENFDSRRFSLDVVTGQTLGNDVSSRAVCEDVRSAMLLTGRDRSTEQQIYRDIYE